MMQQEFEKLTKVKVTSEEYNVIEAAYMACQEDKQVFCKQWLKKDGIRNDFTDPSSVFFHLPFVRLQADFRIQRCEG